MTAKDIQSILAKYYSNGVRYLVPNVYFFGEAYCETDLLVIKEGNGWVYDIEIKISRADFKADFNKKDKHNILRQGEYLRKSTKQVQNEAGLFDLVEVDKYYQSKRPNRFYFAVPDGLIKIDEVPEYAGLLYVNEFGNVTKAKEAPILHREVIEPEKSLCRKFYYAYAELKLYKQENGINKLKSKIAELEKENEQLSKLLRKSNSDYWILERQLKNQSI